MLLLSSLLPLWLMHKGADSHSLGWRLTSITMLRKPMRLGIDRAHISLVCLSVNVCRMCAGLGSGWFLAHCNMSARKSIIVSIDGDAVEIYWTSL